MTKISFLEKNFGPKKNLGQFLVKKLVQKYFLSKKSGEIVVGRALLLIQYKLTLFDGQIRNKLPSVFLKIDPHSVRSNFKNFWQFEPELTSKTDNLTIELIITMLALFCKCIEIVHQAI